MTEKSYPRGIIKIKNEGNFWGIYIPKTAEFIVSKRMGDIKKVLFAHLEVEKMVRPEVEIVQVEDDEYKDKVKDLRRQANSTLEYDKDQRPEICSVVARFAAQEIHIRDTAEFLHCTQKRVNELMRSEA